MIDCYSKRNQVYPTLWQEEAAVEKHFRSIKDWKNEIELYKQLSGEVPLPEMLFSEPGLLVTEYCPYPTLLAELERQEMAGFAIEPWQALAEWLRCCKVQCEQLPVDGNLRNFLWDARLERVIGLDLESYQYCSLEETGAALVAALLEYDPADTSLKQRIAKYLSNALQLTETGIKSARRTLKERRAGKRQRPVSGIILAGGASRRMEKNKAELLLLGKSLLLWQIEKMRALGIEDIILSGKNCPAIPGTQVVPDALVGQGPLCGIHAGLNAAKHQNSLVLSVDVPLVPVSALSHLLRTYEGGVTVLRHAGKREPLIGVYDRSVAQVIPTLLAEENTAVRALEKYVDWTCFDYFGPELYLTNCNTPQEFERVRFFVDSCRLKFQSKNSNDC